MAVQRQDDQHEHTFSNYVRIRDVVQKTCLRRWTIGKSGERGSGISVLPAWHDDDDDIISIEPFNTLLLIVFTQLMLSAYFIYFIILLIGEFFTPALADGFPPEFEWQQVSSSLLDSSLYFGRSQQCCSLDGLHLWSYFKILHTLCQSFGGCIERTNYNWYHRHFHVPKFFNSLARTRYLSLFQLSFSFTLWSARTVKSTNQYVLSFFYFAIIRSGRLAEIRWSACLPKSQRILGVLFSRRDSGLYIYHLFVIFNFLHNSQ